MDYKDLTAPCGLDCFNCTLYLADGDEEIRCGLAARLGVAEEKVRCPGCRPAKGRIDFLGLTDGCGVFRCTRERGFATCAECDDFPCDLLQPLVDKAGQRPHNLKVYNLALIKKLGLDRWAEEKAAEVRRQYFTAKLEL